MKKTFLLICLGAGLLSCTKGMTPQEEAPAGVPLKFEFNIAGTKASKTDWETGDVIVVFFKGLQDKYIEFDYDSDSQKWGVIYTYDITTSDLENLEEKTLTAVFCQDFTQVLLEDDYLGFSDDNNNPMYNYLSRTGVPYTVDGDTVKASFTMEKPEGFVRFHVPGIEGNVSDYTLASPGFRPVTILGVNYDGTLREEVLQAGARVSGFADEDGAIFAGRLVNPEAEAYTFTLSYKDPSNASNDKIYTLTRSSALSAGNQYNFPVLTDDRWTVTPASDLYVDLGLPSGTKWAKWNLGATTETDFGDFFAWGETLGYNSGKTDFSWSTYFDTADNGITFNKYIKNVKMSLDPEDDAAYAALGGRFRMPTLQECDELYQKCSTSWKTTTDGYPCNGILFTAQNGNSIFLPAAGTHSTVNHTDVHNHVGVYGYFWSSDMHEQASVNANILSISADEVQVVKWSRYRGISIRPVYK